MVKRVQISQCMIVKNEEKNIRRALSWGKKIMFEQIVVDTGSTDRTVEIAREMGAKVYHFQWIDDFAAAKNYAIEQASGDWIAFLDADEYMNLEDTKKLMRLLEQTSVPKRGGKIPLFVRCTWVNLDSDGNPFHVSAQDRIFRNRKDLRYYGKIHEQIRMPQNGHFTFIHAEQLLSIYHTGYSAEAYAETGKVQRNIRQLEAEVELNPENYDAWAYLGDAQKASGDLENAKISYRRALKGERGHRKISRQGLMRARGGLMLILAETASPNDSEEEIYQLAESYGYPDMEEPDPWFFLGFWHYKRKEMGLARKRFQEALQRLDNHQGIGGEVARGNMVRIYTWLAQACLELNRPQEVVRYCVLSLRMDRFQERILTSVLQLLKQDPGESAQADGTWKFLGGLYDFQNPKDLLFILKCAKLSGFSALERRTMEALPEELRKEFQKPKDQDTGQPE